MIEQVPAELALVVHALAAVRSAVAAAVAGGGSVSGVGEAIVAEATAAIEK